MAQGNQNTDAAMAWSEAAAKRKYGVHNGQPLVSSEFVDQKIGYIAHVPAPSWFHHVPVNERGFVCAAMLEMAQNRAGQNSKPASAAEYAAAVLAAMSGETPTDRVREKDAILNGVKSEIRAKALAVKPDATPSAIAATIDASGEAYMTKHRDRIVSEGFMVAPRATKETVAASAIPID
jgi:hypothetical protein